MQEQFTVRIYDSKVIKKINKLQSELSGIYSTKNPLLVDCISRGLEVIEREQLGVRNIESLNELYEEIHSTVEKLNTLIKLCENNAKESIANITVNQKLLASNYNMLLGLSENMPKKRDYVEGGMYDDLPKRLEEILEDVLNVFLKK